MIPDRLTTTELATELRLSPHTLRAWRKTGVGPAWYRLGRRVLYDRSDINAWIQHEKEGNS